VDDVETVLDALATVIEPVRLAFLWRPMLPDGDDDMVLETAVNGQADQLVTVDRRDFELAVGAFGLRLASPAEAVRRLRRTP
jgi:predicted nucleic acid-binding protein